MLVDLNPPHVDSRVEEVMWTQNVTLLVEKNLWIQAIALLHFGTKAASSGIRARQVFPASNLGEDVKRQWSFYC